MGVAGEGHSPPDSRARIKVWVSEGGDGALAGGARLRASIHPKNPPKKFWEPHEARLPHAMCGGRAS